MTGGTFTHSSGTVVMENITNSVPIHTLTNITFYNLKHTRSVTTYQNTTTRITGGFTVANDWTVSNSTAQSTGSYSVEIGYLWLYNGGSTFTATVQGDLIFESNAATGNMYFGHTTTPSASFSVNVAGDVTFQDSDALLFTPITLNGTAHQTVTITAGTISAGAWIVNRPSEQRGTAVNLATALSLPSTLTVTAGTLDTSGYNLTTASTFTVSTAGILRLIGSETITTPTLSNGSSVVYDGTTTYTVKDWSYRNLSFSGSGIFNLGAAESIAEVLTLSGGTFDISGNNLTVTGNFYNNGKLRMQGAETTVSLTMDTDSGIVEYDGGSSYTGLKMGNSYFTLSFSGAGTWTLNASVDTNSGFLIPTSTATVSAGSNTLTVGGNWVNRGTFTAGTSTVILDGTSQMLDGSTTFYVLSKTVSAARTLTFTAGQTFIASNTFTLRGASSNVLSLRSSLTGTTYNLRLTSGGTQTIDYLSVQDSIASGGDALLCYIATEGCENATNNTNWSFSFEEPAAPVPFFSWWSFLLMFLGCAWLLQREGYFGNYFTQYK